MTAVAPGPAPAASAAPDRLDVWRRFVEAHAVVVGALETTLVETLAMPLAWYDVLVALDAAPDRRLRMQDLADRVWFTRSGLTRLVDRMVTAGAVTRERCADDRRGTYAVLTAAGARDLAAAHDRYRAGVRDHFARHLDDADAATLDRILTRVLVGGPAPAAPAAPTAPGSGARPEGAG